MELKQSCLSSTNKYNIPCFGYLHSHYILYIFTLPNFSIHKHPQSKYYSEYFGYFLKFSVSLHIIWTLYILTSTNLCEWNISQLLQVYMEHPICYLSSIKILADRNRLRKSTLMNQHRLIKILLKLTLTPLASRKRMAACTGSRQASEALWGIAGVPKENRLAPGSKELRLSAPEIFNSYFIVGLI